MTFTLSKAERISGRAATEALLRKGRWGVLQPVRYCWMADNGAGCNRIMVSVPKRLFKRAVKRNLLKRRMREAYRTQKDLLPQKGIDLMLIYSSKDIVRYDFLKSEISHILAEIAYTVTEG